MAKRQTIWLSTMMVLSLMLIGFYTVNNNVQQVGSGAVTSTSGKASTGQKADPKKSDNTAVMESSDYFIQQHLQENQAISKQQDDLEAVIADANAPADKVDQAKKDLQALNDQEDKIGNLIDTLMQQGYADAIVDMKNGKVNVTVQAQSLTNQNAVKIMSTVSKALNVSAAHITVLTHE